MYPHNLLSNPTSSYQPVSCCIYQARAPSESRHDTIETFLLPLSVDSVAYHRHPSDFILFLFWGKVHQSISDIFSRSSPTSRRDGCVEAGWCHWVKKNLGEEKFYLNMNIHHSASTLGNIPKNPIFQMSPPCLKNTWGKITSHLPQTQHRPIPTRRKQFPHVPPVPHTSHGSCDITTASVAAYTQKREQHYYYVFFFFHVSMITRKFCGCLFLSTTVLFSHTSDCYWVVPAQSTWCIFWSSTFPEF